MLKKYIVIISFLIPLFISIYLFLNLDISKDNKETKYINITLNEKLLSIPLGTTFKDVLIMNNFDINDNYSIALDYVLKDNETINLNNEANNKNKISINTSCIEELITLPGIGEKTAYKIIEYRNTYGLFKHIEELKNVSGIGDKKYEKIKELITI